MFFFVILNNNNKKINRNGTVINMTAALNPISKTDLLNSFTVSL